ncbi:MAG: hypothetical protein J7M14_01230, partial [Planctomycetes bacterium]|nr:hypothetical protein [Planctomycetota bacterium]
LYHARGLHMTITTGHPAMIRSLAGRDDWRATTVAKTGASDHGNPDFGRKTNGAARKTSQGRAVVGFSYRP